MPDEIKNNITYKIVAGALITIVGFFCVNFYNSILDIQKELVIIKMKLQEVELKMITTDRVREIAHDQIIKYHRYSHGDLQVKKHQ